MSERLPRLISSGRPGTGALVLILLTVAVLGLALAGEQARLLLRFERGAIADGELWRLLSAHLVHLGWRHALLDLAAALMIGALFGDRFRPGRWLWIGATSALAVAAGLWWFSPGIDWYVGLSGVLHGALAAVAISLAREGRTAGYLLLTALVAKLAYELWAGPLWMTAEAAGGPVIVEAHLYGALGGVLAAVLPRVARSAVYNR
jgi:rhomboid family GlyGly-CTERM serine protease